MNPGCGGCGEARSHHCTTPAWVTKAKLHLKKKKKEKEKKRKENRVLSCSVSQAAAAAAQSLYAFSARPLAGREPVSLDSLRDKVLLIENVASL